jgi:hypothetical protein
MDYVCRQSRVAKVAAFIMSVMARRNTTSAACSANNRSCVSALTASGIRALGAPTYTAEWVRLRHLGLGCGSRFSGWVT